MDKIKIYINLCVCERYHDVNECRKSCHCDTCPNIGVSLSDMVYWVRTSPDTVDQIHSCEILQVCCFSRLLNKETYIGRVIYYILM